MSHMDVDFDLERNSMSPMSAVDFGHVYVLLTHLLTHLLKVHNDEVQEVHIVQETDNDDATWRIEVSKIRIHSILTIFQCDFHTNRLIRE